MSMETAAGQAEPLAEKAATETPVVVLPVKRQEAAVAAASELEDAPVYATFLSDLRRVVSELEKLQEAVKRRHALVESGVEVGAARVQERPTQLSSETILPALEGLGEPLLDDSDSPDGNGPGVSYRLEAMYFVARRVVSDTTADNLLKEVVEYAIQLGHYRFGLVAACAMRAVSNADAGRGKVVEAALKEGDYAFALLAAELIENRSAADGNKGKVIKALRSVGKGGPSVRYTAGA